MWLGIMIAPSYGPEEMLVEIFCRMFSKTWWCCQPLENYGFLGLLILASNSWVFNYKKGRWNPLGLTLPLSIWNFANFPKIWCNSGKDMEGTPLVPCDMRMEWTTQYVAFTCSHEHDPGSPTSGMLSSGNVSIHTGTSIWSCINHAYIHSMGHA